MTMVRLTCLLLFLAAASTQAQDVAQDAVPVVIDERAILTELFDSTEGWQWRHKEGWGSDNSTDLCDWHGVLCKGNDQLPVDVEERRLEEETDTDSDSVVIGLSLTGNYLQGSMPDSVWSLPSLKFVDVSYNEEFTVSFAALPQVENSLIHTIRIHDTDTVNMTGIEGAAETLQSFHVSGVPMSSQFPTELLQLTKLRFLHMSNCNLHGPIPEEIGQLSDLREFNVGENKLTGAVPEGLASLQHVRILALAKNKFEGTIPDFLSQLNRLHELWLNNNKFTGPVPSFSTHPSLYKLFMQSNSLTGNLPADFLAAAVNDPKHTVVDLSNNELSGTVPASLEALAPLHLTLNLADNRYVDVAAELCDNEKWNSHAVTTANEPCWGILCPVGTFSRHGHGTGTHTCAPCDSAEYAGATFCDGNDDTILRSLYIVTDGEHWRHQDNWMEDDEDICDWYGVECNDNDQVETLNLAANGLSGTIPETIFQMKALRTLNVNRNEVVLPFERISWSPVIEQINIASTLTRDFEGIEDARSQFKYLHADSLPIDGVIPSEVLQVTSLEVLSMAGCQLNGEINPDIVDLYSLEELYLYDNDFRGTIPGAMGEMINLRVVSLANNQLEGLVPDMFESLHNLEALSLSDQVSKGGGLVGELPSFSSSHRLTMLMMANNKLEGPIPRDLLETVDEDSTVTVDLRNNRIEGSVPGELSRFNYMNIYLEGNEITDIDDDLCFMEDWMGGLVAEYQCDAILCPNNTSGGRQVFRDGECQSCPDNDGDYIGQEHCPVRRS